MVYQMKELNPLWRETARYMSSRIGTRAFAWTGSAQDGEVVVYTTDGRSIIVTPAEVRSFCNFNAHNLPVGR